MAQARINWRRAQACRDAVCRVQGAAGLCAITSKPGPKWLAAINSSDVLRHLQRRLRRCFLQGRMP
jgi:hypothetical protein